MGESVLTAVRTSSPLSVDVSELLRLPGSSKELRFRFAVGGLRLPLARIDEETEVEFDLRMDALVDGIHVTGTLTQQVLLECRRCLDEVSGTSTIDFDALYLYPGDNDDDDGDSYLIADEMIDLEPAVRDAVLLELPLHPLCREDCKGLCLTCGANRNHAECGHDQGHIDIRWDALGRLRRQMEE